MDKGGEIVRLARAGDELLDGGVEVSIALARELVGVGHGHFAALGPLCERFVEVQEV